jgi:integrase
MHVVFFAMNERIVIRKGSRIFTPKQYRQFREALDPNGGYRIILDVLVNTGLRIVEFWYVARHPECYHASARVIDLPKAGAAKKPKAKTTDRTIQLTAAGCKALETLYASEIGFRDRTSMREAFIRAAKKVGVGVEGINPKMCRKWLVSWLFECRKDLGIDSADITANMGHGEDVMIQNYLGIFSIDDHQDILGFLKGWGGS